MRTDGGARGMHDILQAAGCDQPLDVGDLV